jgi:hypothetical protein
MATDSSDVDHWFHANSKPNSILYGLCSLSTGGYDAVDGALEANSIVTLPDLLQNTHCVSHLLKDGDDSRLQQRLACALSRTTPETMLGGRLVSYAYDESFPGYKLESVNVVPDKIERSIPNFTLVVGPLGSGKTYFAVNRLYELVFPGVSETEIVRVLIKPNPVIRYIKKNEGADCPASIVDCVKGCIERKLEGFGDVSSSIQLYLHVIFDDISIFQNDFRESLEEYMNTTEKIEGIVKALKTMAKYNFDKGVHLTLVGNDLDAYTYHIDRDDTIKFRMQPWTKNNFFALLGA